MLTVRVKWGERVFPDRQWCIMSPWLFNVYMDAVMKEVRMGMGREWRLSGIFYADDLVLCGNLKEDLRGMVGPFV